jgi:ureidoacrylate peracid hydrolase
MSKTTICLPGRYYRDFPPGKPLGYATDALELALDNTVFLIVDVYGKGFDPDQDLGDAPEFYTKAVQEHRDIVVNHIKPAKEAAKRLGVPIVYLTNYLSPGLGQCRCLGSVAGTQ